MIFIALSPLTVGVLLVPLSIIAILLQFVYLKPATATTMSKMEYYQYFAESEDGRELGAKTLQQIPPGDIDVESFFGPKNKEWWCYYIMDTITFLFSVYTLDPTAQITGSKNILVDRLSVETRAIPQRRDYERAKLAYTESLEDIIERAKGMGLNEQSLQNYFLQSKSQRAEKVETALNKPIKNS